METGVSDLLAAVIKDEPQWSGLPPGVPVWLRKLLRRCLAKAKAIWWKVAPEVWDRIAEHMSKRIREEGFAPGICRGIEEIGLVLAEHFPPAPDDENELPDRPSGG